MMNLSREALTIALEAMDNENGSYAAKLVNQLPADANVAIGEYPTNETGWMSTKVGNVTVEIAVYHDGVFCNVYSSSNEVLMPNGKFFRTDKVYDNGVHLCYFDECSDPYDFKSEDKDGKLDMSLLTREFRQAVYAQPCMLESGTMTGLTGEKFYVVKKDSCLNFVRKDGKILRVSTPVICDEIHSNGYRKVITTSGNVYHLTTV